MVGSTLMRRSGACPRNSSRLMQIGVSLRSSRERPPVVAQAGRVVHRLNVRSAVT